FIWKADLSFATSLYYAFRYTALFNTIMILLTQIAWTSWQSISVTSSLQQMAIRLGSLVRNDRSSHLPCAFQIVGNYTLFERCVPAIFTVDIDYSNMRLVVRMTFSRTSESHILIVYATVMMAATAASLVSDGLVLTLT
ncbi:uncharacterized protein LAESUDRAFT_636977, partial [Laetiporus sulphureus 93-53]